MKILLTGDWQVSPKNLDRCKIALEFFLRVIGSYKVDAVGLLGDMKHAFNPVDQRVTNFLLHMGYDLNQCKELSSTFVLEGNHDRVAIADGSETGLPVFAAAGVEAITSPHQFTWVDKKDRSIARAWCVPFYRDLQATELAIERGAKQAEILFFHNEVKGCDMGGAKLPTGIDPKLLAKYEVCIGGHIHKQQQVTDNTWFVGSPFCHDWGEANQFKGFLLLDTKTFKVTPIQTPIATWYDPALPGYKPKTWPGVNVRIKLPHDQKLAEVTRAKAEKEYPGAVFHFENQRTTTPSNLALENASDPELIRQYLQQNQLWPERAQLEAYLEYKMADLGTGLRGLRGCKFQGITGSNVLCFEEITLSLNRPGITLVTGKNQDWGSDRSNGSGKTSLLGLPLILLYGRTAKGQEADGWARQGTKAKVLLQGNLKLADGRTLGITRGRRPSKLEATLEGVPLGAGDARGVQKAITDYTGLSWEVLMASLYVGQAEASTLLCGTDKERKELFNQFLGLQRFQIAVERVTADVKKTKRCMEEMEQQLFSLVQSIQQNTVWVKRLEEEEAEHAKKQKEVQQWQKELDADSKQQQALFSQVQKELRELGRLQTIVLNNQHEEVVFVERLRSVQSSITAVKQGKNCPVCGRPLPKQEKANTEHLQKEVIALTRKIQQAQANLTASLELRDAQQYKVNKLQYQFHEAQTRVSVNKTRLNDVGKNSVKSGLLKEAQQELQQHLRQAGWCKQYIEYLREHLDFLEAAMQVVGRNGLPAFLCSLVCPQLNEAAEEFSNAFAEAGVRVVFSGVEGEVDVQVENPHGGEGIEDQSAGEMRLAALIASFAMRSVLAPFGLLILDEPGEGMDAVNASIFAKGLSQVAQRFGSVLITSHNPNIIEGLDFQHHIEIVKQNRVSVACDRG